MIRYILFESASGYALFERIGSDEIGQDLVQVQESMQALEKLGKLVKLKAFLPFQSAEQALENINAISDGSVTQLLKDFLEMNFPKVKHPSKASFMLGVAEPKLGMAIYEALHIHCTANELVMDLFRSIRLFFVKFIRKLKEGDLEKSQLGLGHSFSRAKVKFNVNKADIMIIQAICILDQLDKDINTFSMRIREWYSWHFPELIKIVNDNQLFARVVQVIQHKSQFTEDKLPMLEQILMDNVKARQIFDAARSSMGTDIGDVDMISILNFASRVISLVDYRKSLHQYLITKMHIVAPNLSALIGEMVGARLISHAGSLTNLAKYPASTVQILGAEKALFRALKTQGNTPKYGLIFHSSFIGRATAKNKGRISRYLANKCSIAARIDCFSERLSAAATWTVSHASGEENTIAMAAESMDSQFGEALRQQVEDRLQFYETGVSPRRNVDVMKQVIDCLDQELQSIRLPPKTPLTDIDQLSRPDKKRKREHKTEEEKSKKLAKSKTSKDHKHTLGKNTPCSQAISIHSRSLDQTSDEQKPFPSDKKKKSLKKDKIHSKDKYPDLHLGKAVEKSHRTKDKRH